ncbi:MAG: hypothetical protein DRN30_02880 [Thermoplasmata archaeon]|nr:MAG: hypothetical protein DRN30_02880 [Thermoplasmata archaeon]
MPRGVDIREQARRQGKDFKEFCSEAGKKARGKPKRVRLSPKRICRKDKCPIYDYCFAKYLSVTKFGGRCALYHMPERIKEGVFKFAEKGRQGAEEFLIELFFSLYIEYLGEEKLSFSEKLKFFREVRDFVKTLYGEKKVIEASVSKGIDWEDVLREYEEWLKEEEGKEDEDE